MTESDWLACDDPARMLRELLEATVLTDSYPGTRPWWRRNDRKLRLFCAACVAVSSYDYPDVFPEWEDGEPSALEQGGGRPAEHARLWCDPESDNEGDPAMAFRAGLLRDIVGNPFRPVKWRMTAVLKCGICGGYGHTEEKAHPQVLSLAWAAYEGRELQPEWGLEEYHRGAGGQQLRRREVITGYAIGATLDPVRLMILADALEEAGCPDGDLLRHLRGWRQVGTGDMQRWVSRDGPHVRGCWAVDLVLGKE